MREIVLDTETTGLDPAAGHRLVEIACLEMNNGLPTGRYWQCYINPERDMPEEAFRVHGLSEDFLSAHPVFADVAEDFLAFIDQAALVIHNAEFDMKFLNAELERLGRPSLAPPQVIDTVRLARQRFPGAPASLDALCRRFGIDNTARELHGALLDARLLAEVYVELTGGRQSGLALADESSPRAGGAAPSSRPVRLPRPHAPSPEELAAHAAFLETLTDPIWTR